jgi:hypothetical protein
MDDSSPSDPIKPGQIFRSLRRAHLNILRAWIAKKIPIK